MTSAISVSPAPASVAWRLAIPAAIMAMALTAVSPRALAAAAAEAPPYPIAGLKPQQRPAGAPVMTQAPALPPLALTGVTSPVPASIERWSKNQGAWYSPFLHPGMPGPYDLRGWHQPAAAVVKH